LAGVVVLALSTGCMGAHVQAGPTVGYSFKRGPTFGWEVGAGSVGVVRVSTGGTYRLEPAGEPEGPEAEAARPVQSQAGKPSAAFTDGSSDAEAPRGTPASEDEGASPDAIHYLALEPLALSLGVTLPNIGKPGILYGVWAGWFFDPNAQGAVDPNPFLPQFDCPNSEPEPGFLLSGAVGLRYMGGEWEAYFTPKAVVLWCVEYAS
jgi:hypothetical protein